jgi:GT2 family glycosyltransferase
VNLSIIIVNWNSRQYLQKCIASIVSETSGLEYEIIVIDAGSFDGCDQMLKETYSEVRFIQSDKNIGFAKANNMAFRASTGACLLFLNPDTELSEPAINVMYENLQRIPNVGAVGCKLLNSDRTVQTSCIQSMPTILNQLLDSDYLRARWPRSALWGTSPLYENDAEPKVVEAIVGACIMLKREVFERIGLFSEDYFMYAEDIDLCYKVRQAGYTNYYIPVVTMIHHGGGSSQVATSSFSTVMMRESVWRFFRKTHGRGYGMGYRAAMLVSAFIRLVLLLMLFPIQQANRRRPSWNASLQKWLAVFRWSLKQDKWLNSFHDAKQ